jgi:hypothetical protein
MMGDFGIPHSKTIWPSKGLFRSPRDETIFDGVVLQDELRKAVLIKTPIGQIREIFPIADQGTIKLVDRSTFLPAISSY